MRRSGPRPAPPGPDQGRRRAAGRAPASPPPRPGGAAQGRRRPERGFTLLETLVAFAIAALALGALYEGGLAALATTRAATRTEEALARARSHLAAVGPAPQAGDREGDEGGGFHWRVRVVSRGVRAAGPPGGLGLRPPPRLGLYAVTVAISWTEAGRRHAVSLDTERLGPAGGPEGP